MWDKLKAITDAGHTVEITYIKRTECGNAKGWLVKLDTATVVVASPTLPNAIEQLIQHITNNK